MSDIRLIQLNQYIRPEIKENKTKNWVLNGQNNSFYKYIIDRYKGSPTNSVIINSYNTLVYGRGLDARNRDVATWVKFKSLLSKKEFKKIIADFNLFGEATLQIVKTKDKKGISGIYHLPKNLVAPTIENEDNEIEGYWYCKDWSNTTKNKPEFYPAFGTSGDAIEIYHIKPYTVGNSYFGEPSYFSAFAYCEMEEELSNFYINSIRKGLSAGYIVNVPDGGTLTSEAKDELERKIKQKLVGSPNAMSFVINFKGRDADITVTPFPVNDAQHKQWEYLTEESRQQIMTAHSVVSPKLFGIMADGGLGNNANELDEAEAQMMKRVIAPRQEELTDALEEILGFYNMNLDLYFLPLTEPQQAQTPTQMSSHKSDLDLFIEMGEDEEIDGYELVDVKPVDYEEEEKMQFATETGVARPNSKSKFDTDYYIYRYRYAGNQNPEREFCQRMMKANKIYRREDIELMGTKNVNPGFGMHPTPYKPYSIWKFKGGGLLSAEFTGGTCKHYWEKLTYKKKGVKIDVNNPINEPKVNRASGIAGIAPHDM